MIECLQLDPKKRPSLPQIKSIIIGGGIPLNSPTNLNSVSEEQTLKKVKKAVSKSSFVDFKLMHKGEKYAIYGDATSSINGEFSNEA